MNLIGRKFKLKCTLSNDGTHYKNFGIHPKTCSVYGVNEKDIVEVELEVIDQKFDKTAPKSGEYWGFFSYEDEKLSMVYPSRIQYQVCFTYGPTASEESGKGMSVKLKINK